MNAIGLGELAAATDRVGVSVDGLIVMSRASFRRALLAMLALVAFNLASAVVVIVVLAQSYAQADHIEAVLAQVSIIATEQTAARKAALEVKEKVDVAAAAAETKPTIELAPATSASPRARAAGAAVLVIKARPKPISSAGVTFTPPAAAPAEEIRIPVQLPPSATAVPAGSAKP